MRQDVLHAARRRQAQLATQAAFQRRQVHIQAFQPIKDVSRGLQQRLRSLGQVQLAANIFEQRQTDLFFKLANLQADRRLGQCHGFGRAAVGAVLTHRAEHLQLAQGHSQQRFAHDGLALMNGAALYGRRIYKQ